MSSPDEPRGFFQYLPNTHYDKITGFFITDFGWTEILPNMSYPPWQHPSKFNFNKNEGRCLDEYQLVYITKGSGTFWSNATGTLRISAGTLFLLFPGVRHKYCPDRETGWDEMWFGFRGEVADRIMESYFDQDKPVLPVGIKVELLNLFEKIRTLSKMHNAGYRRIMALTAHEILVRLQVATREDGNADNEIESACQYIEEHSKEAIDFKTYAESIGQSYSSFRRRFKSYSGLAPHKYQLEARLRNAKQLLDNTTLSIQRVANKCGFECPYYFSRYFKSTTGLSPRQYRCRWETEKA